MNHVLEIIGFNIESCIIAQASGAHRIELCAGPGEGGTTPSFGFIKSARQQLHIQLYPIIRPRGGDFLYSEAEFEIMKTDISLCKKLGCDGVVIGLLNEDGTVDKNRCSQLVELAYPMGVTFHRAFDRTIDAFEAMEDIIETGCERILTSGQKPMATDALDLIGSLVKKADDRIIIMLGSAVRADNIIEIAGKTKATEFHTSARRLVESGMKFISETMQEKLQSVSVDAGEIMKIQALLNEFKIYA